MNETLTDEELLDKFEKVSYISITLSNFFSDSNSYGSQEYDDAKQYRNKAYELRLELLKRLSERHQK